MSCVIREMQTQNNNETPPHTYENGPNPEHRHHQMLTRMWNSRNPHSLLVGRHNGAAALEGSWAVFYKTKPTLTI